jgi:hypothetical protein
MPAYNPTIPSRSTIRFAALNVPVSAFFFSTCARVERVMSGYLCYMLSNGSWYVLETKRVRRTSRPSTANHHLRRRWRGPCCRSVVPRHPALSLALLIGPTSWKIRTVHHIRRSTRMDTVFKRTFGKDRDPHVKTPRHWLLPREAETCKISRETQPIGSGADARRAEKLTSFSSPKSICSDLSLM